MASARSHSASAETRDDDTNGNGQHQETSLMEHINSLEAENKANRIRLAAQADEIERLFSESSTLTQVRSHGLQKLVDKPNA